ncbi:MAG TPA: bifunctional acetate--CoA ligase family protein/GNAT family N-acetyltransferase [Candidatus Limnocylindrales bacterium]|nr:bifunctional acetate--CoA ligase family protein/GNAT family N-acetyltransferase [Candidatus Limnocylindrales bacterium]
MSERQLDAPTLIEHASPRPTGLDAIFFPKSVAVIGATDRVGSVGRTIVWNLISSPFNGTVYPVNPTKNSILGIRAYPDVASIPEQVDLAVIVTPAKTVPKLVKDCVTAGVRGFIVISAGFKETGLEGVKLEQEILATIRKHNVRLVGPNCLGVMSPISGLNATFAAGQANRGNVAFISQSGALCTAVLDWSYREKVGFSAFVSIGSMLDVGWGDLIDYLGNDENTHSIVIYMESVGDARSFLSAAREVAMRKPVIVIKAGRTAAAAQAAASHTGSLTGSDDVLDAAFRRAGVLRVDRISDVFNIADLLAKQPRPRGPRLTLITNAGGPGVLAVDALITGGGELTEISEDTMNALNQFLPGAWSHNNPIDVLGDAGPDIYARTLEVAGNDPNSDGLLVILTPQAMTDSTKTAMTLLDYAKIPDKPVLASWMGGPAVAEAVDILNEAGVPVFSYPDTAARVFNSMWQYSKNLAQLYETPILPPDSFEESPDRAKVEALLKGVRDSGRTILTEFESKELLAAYCLPTVMTVLAETVDDAVAAADRIGYPVVIKLNSFTLTHKTDVGGVQLNLRDANAVRAAYDRMKASVTEKAGAEHFNGVTVQPMANLDGYELIIGSSIDQQFGPVLLFGSGGQLVEVYKDSALALPPLTTNLAHLLMEETKIYEALLGVRGRPPVDMVALEQLLVRFSQLVVEQPWIKEIDINPLLVSHEQLLALDARVLLFPPDTKPEDLPRPAIRPYPVQYVGEWQSKDGSDITFRPIQPEDEVMLRKFHETLSERTVHMRYLKAMQLSQRIAHERLARLCYIDYDREIALIAVRRNPYNNAPELMAVGRLTKRAGTNSAEYAMIVSDRFQHQGLGSEMLRRLIAIARDEHVGCVFGTVLEDNSEMLSLVEKLGFVVQPTENPSLLRAEITL